MYTLTVKKNIRNGPEKLIQKITRDRNITFSYKNLNIETEINKERRFSATPFDIFIKYIAENFLYNYIENDLNDTSYFNTKTNDYDNLSNIVVQLFRGLHDSTSLDELDEYFLSDNNSEYKSNLEKFHTNFVNFDSTHCKERCVKRMIYKKENKIGSDKMDEELNLIQDIETLNVLCNRTVDLIKIEKDEAAKLTNTDKVNNINENVNEKGEKNTFIKELLDHIKINKQLQFKKYLELFEKMKDIDECFEEKKDSIKTVLLDTNNLEKFFETSVNQYTDKEEKLKYINKIKSIFVAAGGKSRRTSTKRRQRHTKHKRGWKLNKSKRSVRHKRTRRN